MKIAIIGAMEKEVKEYIKYFNLEEIENKIWAKDNVILAESGIGKVNAAMMVQHIIDKYTPDYIISTGCAGALCGSLKVLDVVIPDYVTYHDFLPERVMEYSVPDNGHIKIDNNLKQIAISVAETMQDVHIVRENICSGDCYVTDTVTAENIMKRTNARVVDMESAAIGHVARKNNIPFITIRSISDFANGNDDLEEKAGEVSFNIVKNMIAIVTNL